MGAYGLKYGSTKESRAKGGMDEGPDDAGTLEVSRTVREMRKIFGAGTD